MNEKTLQKLIKKMDDVEVMMRGIKGTDVSSLKNAHSKLDELVQAMKKAGGGNVSQGIRFAAKYDAVVDVANGKIRVILFDPANSTKEQTEEGLNALYKSLEFPRFFDRG